MDTKSIQKTLKEAEKDFLHFEGKKYILFSTTVNPANPEFYRARNKKDSHYLVVHFLIKNKKYIHIILKRLAKLVDAVLVDPEIKTPYINIRKEVLKSATKHPVYALKTNDATTFALMTLINTLHMETKKISVIGAGNIGTKATLALLESQYQVSLISRSKSKVHSIKSALNLFGHFKPSLLTTSETIQESVDKNEMIILCGPGKTILTPEHFRKSGQKLKVVIDVGGNGIEPEAISLLLKRKISIYSLDSSPGILSAIHCLEKTKLKYSIGKIKKVKGVTPLGMLGLKGDIIYDYSQTPAQEIGIADGLGGFTKITNRSNK